MHFHADRYWFLGSGTGTLQDCLDFNGYQEGTPTFWGDTANTPFPIEEDVIAGWIRIRTQIMNVGGKSIILGVDNKEVFLCIVQTTVI